MNNQSNNKRRPFFISFLGRLSFIGVAIQLIYGIVIFLGGIILTSENNVNINPDTEIKIGMDHLNTLNNWLILANKSVQYSTILGILNILAAIFCFIGVVKMWRLNKNGYYYYASAELLVPVITIILTGFSGFWMNVIFPVTFLFLWAVNIKKMN